MSSSKLKVSVVVVTYNSKHLVDECLRPFFGHDPNEIEIFVVDNASSDGTAEIVSQRYPFCKVIANKENHGFSAGNNTAIPLCRGEYVLLLNPDVFLTSMDPIRRTYEFLDEHRDVGVAGVQNVDEAGHHQVGDCGWRLTMAHAISHAFLLHNLFPSFRSLYLSNPRLLARDQVDLDWVGGGFMMVRSSVFKQCGMLDDSIFMYGEDVEFGVRVRRHGHGVVYLPQIKVHHLNNGTQRKRQENFVSTKFISSWIKQFRTSDEVWPIGAFRLVFGMGFVNRAIIYWLRGKVLRRGTDIDQARKMRVFAAEAFTGAIDGTR